MNWKGQLIQVFTFTALPILGVLAAWFALRSRRVAGLSPRGFALLAAGLFLLTRLGTHVLVFHVFRYPGGSDLLRVWEPVARAVLEGRDPVPFIDNLYGPLYPLILAAGYGLSGGRYAPGIDAPFVLADGLALVLLLRIARRRMGEDLARRLALVVLLSPLLWHGVTVRTQDEPLFALFLLLTLDLLDRGKEGPGIAAAVLGSLCTKAVFPLWVLPVLLAAGGGGRRVLIRTATAGCLTLLGMLLFPALGWGADGLPLAIDVRGSSSWLLFPGAEATSGTAFRVGLAATALACAAAAWIAVRAGPADLADRSSLGIVAAQAAFFVVCPFTLPPHLVQGLPFLAWQAIREGAADPRPPRRAWFLGTAFCLWQVPAVSLNSEFWSAYPWLVAAWVATWAASGWMALAADSGRGRLPRSPSP